MSYIADRLIPWQKVYGRHELPWQRRQEPYAIWLSEIMLQQTQVNTVIPYYQRFILRFPDIASLARASEDDVLAHWSGLGYYSRARNLHKAACLVVSNHSGVLPNNREDLQQLPGIGRSTAAAIMVFAYGRKDAILDGNVKRVFARFFGVEGYLNDSLTQKKLWRLAEECLPERCIHNNIRYYTQALMDLGSTICMRYKPLCDQCPLQQRCAAFTQNRVALLPAVKPRKPLPVKETIFMVYYGNGKLLLRKRPGSGIWSGLWCFPENELTEDNRLLEKTSQPVALPQFLHTFTHFKLSIHPYFQEVNIKSISCDAFMWTAPDEALGLAIPVPVKKLIQQHFAV